MKGILKEELNRAFRNPRYILVILLALAFLVIGLYRFPATTNLAGQSMHPVNRLILNLEYGEFGFLAALLATLPFADSFLDDLNQGFLRQIVQRVSYRKYQVAKIISVALAGGISLVIVVMMVFLIGLLGDVSWETTAFASGYAHNPTEPVGPLGSLYTLNPVYYLFYILLSAFGFGATQALMGLAFSTVIHNRYVVLAMPLVIVQVLDFLQTRALHVTSALNLLNGLLPFNAPSYLSSDYTVGTQLAQFGVVFFLSSVAFLMLARKQRLVL
jgi:hypothetical protein